MRSVGMTWGSITSPGSDPGKGVLPPHPVLQKGKLRPQAELAGRVQTRGRCAPRHTQDSGSHGVCSPLRGQGCAHRTQGLGFKAGPFPAGDTEACTGGGAGLGIRSLRGVVLNAVSVSSSRVPGAADVALAAGWVGWVEGTGLCPAGTEGL